MGCDPLEVIGRRIEIESPDTIPESRVAIAYSQKTYFLEVRLSGQYITQARHSGPIAIVVIDIGVYSACGQYSFVRL